MSVDVSSDVTLFRWKIVNFRRQWHDFKREKQMFFSDTFQLFGQPSVQFALYVDTKIGTHEKKSAGVILKQSNDKPIEASVKVWIESTIGQRFGVAFVEKHAFNKVGDKFGCNGIHNGNMRFWGPYKRHETFYICCKIDDLNKHVAPTMDHEKEFLHNHDKEFLHNHWALFEKEYHDAVIKIDGTEFKILKAFFVSQSEVFERMFVSNFKKGITGKVVVNDIEPETMKHLVKWMYVGQLKDDSPIEKLFEVADKYNIKLLKKMCTANMLDTLDATNAFQRLIIASLHNDKDLKQATLDVIAELSTTDFANFFGSDEWLEFTSKNLDIAKDFGTLIRKKMRK